MDIETTGLTSIKIPAVLRDRLRAEVGRRQSADGSLEWTYALAIAALLDEQAARIVVVR